MLDENGDLVKGDFNISEYTDMADEIKETANIDISIIYGDTRYMTSLLDSNGQRMTGTKADAATIEAVVGRGEELFVENTEVDGVAYYGYYIPLLDFTTGEGVGMVFAGMPQVQVQKEIRNIVVTIVVLAVIVMIVCAGLIFFVVGKMSKRLNVGVSALEEVSRGKLNFKFDEDSLRQSEKSAGRLRSWRRICQVLLMMSLRRARGCWMHRIICATEQVSQANM